MGTEYKMSRTTTLAVAMVDIQDILIPLSHTSCAWDCPSERKSLSSLEKGSHGGHLGGTVSGCAARAALIVRRKEGC